MQESAENAEYSCVCNGYRTTPRQGVRMGNHEENATLSGPSQEHAFF